MLPLFCKINIFIGYFFVEIFFYKILFYGYSFHAKNLIFPFSNLGTFWLGIISKNKAKFKF